MVGMNIHHICSFIEELGYFANIKISILFNIVLRVSCSITLLLHNFRQILKKRKMFEYKLKRQTKVKNDYLQYIQVSFACSTQLSTQSSMLINVKMPTSTIVGVLIS